MTMTKRGGPPVKLLIIVAVFLSCVYFIYVYHNKLRDAEASAEKYRRSDEAKVAQLQDSMKEKEIVQEKCESDRQEFLNRLNSLNSQHKMLKGQHGELEAENGRLQQDVQKLRDDNANIEAQRTQEFNQMKQEKDLEIASLKDQLANLQRQSDQFQNEISGLKSQLENAQQNAAAAVNAMKELQQPQQQQIAQIQQDVQQQQLQQNGVQLNQQAAINPQDLVYQNQQGQGQVQMQGQGQAQLQGQGLGINGVQNMNQNVGQQNEVNQNAQIPAVNQDQAAAAAALAAAQQQQGQADFNAVQGAGQLAVDNAQHQMEAPNMGGDGLNQGGVNQSLSSHPNTTASVGSRHTEKPLLDLKIPTKEKAETVPSKNGTLSPKKLLDQDALFPKKLDSIKDKIELPKDDRDNGHLDIVQNNGQIFKPEFNLNKFDTNDKDTRGDNYRNPDHHPEESEHDNRLLNEGPVNLQVQEPPNRNFDENKHIPQQLAAAKDVDQDIQPLQAQGQGNDLGQIHLPDFGLAKHKEGDGVHVEGEGRKEAPMPHEM